MTDAHCHVSGGDPSVRELLIGRDFVGVHPWEARSGRSACNTLQLGNGGMGAEGAGGVGEWLREQLAANPRLGVGEIGLDRLKEKTISSEMRELFAAQLALALEFNRPVVLHGAKCWGEVVKQVTRNREQGTSEECLTSCSSVLPESDASATTRVPCSLFHVTSSPLLFHGFSRSDGLIPEIVRLNGYISVGPAVLNDHAVNYRELVKKIPLDRLLVETDRDCPCEELLNPLTKQPLSIRDVLEKTSEIRGLSPAELEAVVDENASRFVAPLTARCEVKVCGIAEAAFAAEAERLGADYLGFIFAEGSPRRVDAATVRRIRAGLRGTAKIVGVFTTTSVSEVVATARTLSLDVVQLHRRATEQEVMSVRMAGFEVWTLAGGAEGDGVLFDSSHGDGVTALRRGNYKSILAGGISEKNLAQALALKPDVIDVSGSLETSPGVKSINRLRTFFRVLITSRSGGALRGSSSRRS